jgi:hypothetical protein
VILKRDYKKTCPGGQDQKVLNAWNVKVAPAGVFWFGQCLGSSKVLHDLLIAGRWKSSWRAHGEVIVVNDNSGKYPSAVAAALLFGR